MNILSYMKQCALFFKGNARLKALDFERALSYLNNISDRFPRYPTIAGMTAYCYVRLGRFNDAKESINRLRCNADGDMALLAYADHLEAVMSNDLQLYRTALEQYNATIDDAFDKRNLPVFYPKTHGGLH